MLKDDLETLWMRSCLWEIDVLNKTLFGVIRGSILRTCVLIWSNIWWGFDGNIVSFTFFCSPVFLRWDMNEWILKYDVFNQMMRCFYVSNHVMLIENPKEMFDALSSLFKGRNINRKMTLRNHLKSVRAQKLETM